MIVKVFDKDSIERVKNGHYKINIEGSFIDFMSVWTFKNEYNLPDNNREKNAFNTKEMNAVYGEYPYKCITEKGESIEVALHPIQQMQEYYNIS